MCLRTAHRVGDCAEADSAPQALCAMQVDVHLTSMLSHAVPTYFTWDPRGWQQGLQVACHPLHAAVLVTVLIITSSHHDVVQVDSTPQALCTSRAALSW